MSKKDEILISGLIEKNLEVKLNGTKYKLKGWGEVDNWVEICDNVFLFIEVETSQKHPNTNVLKLCPFLEENKEMTIYLIQTNFTDSPAVKSNRGRLAKWLAGKMTDTFKGRFVYRRVVIDKDTMLPVEGSDFVEVKKNLNEFTQKTCR